MNDPIELLITEHGLFTGDGRMLAKPWPDDEQRQQAKQALMEWFERQADEQLLAQLGRDNAHDA